MPKEKSVSVVKFITSVEPPRSRMLQFSMIRHLDLDDLDELFYQTQFSEIRDAIITEISFRKSVKGNFGILFSRIRERAIRIYWKIQYAARNPMLYVANLLWHISYKIRERYSTYGQSK